MTFRAVFVAVVIAFSLIVGAFINGAPPLAPLLFPNLAILGLIAISQLRASADERAIS